MTDDRSEQAKRLIAQAKNLPDQSRTESSKFINFLLEYDCKAGQILDPMIAKIISEIEQSEYDIPPSENGRYPRLNRRAADPNRRFKRAVRVLALNLFQLIEIRKHDVYLALSLDANSYILGGGNRYSPHDMTYDPFIEAYDGLLRLGYADLKHKGYHDDLNAEGMCTRISASQNLIDLYEDVKGAHEVRYYSRKPAQGEKNELIILKGENPRRKGVIIKLQYKDNTFTNKARSNLKQINRVIARHEIKLNCTPEQRIKMMEALRGKSIDDPEQVTYIDDSAAQLYRIFSEGSFKRGGRFYRAWWQQVPKDYRKFIVIDEQETTELDYSRYHISIAYAQLGLKPPKDAYDIHSKVHIDIIKYAINAMMNAKDDVKSCSEFDAKKCGMTWKKLLRLIEKVHHPIVTNGMWNTGYGLTLQFLDSRIAEEIMLHFAKQDVPCLSVHDSFIVPKSYKTELGRL